MEKATAGSAPADRSPSTDRSLYIVFLDQAPGALAGVQTRCQALLESLGGNLTAAEIFDRLNGFTVLLSDRQARRLRALGGVRSVEADSIASLEKVTVSDFASQSLALQPLGATAGVGAAALTPQGDTRKSSGEWLTYGVKEVWGGTDPSTLGNGNAGSGTYAFILDTGVTTTTGDLVVNSSWAKSWVGGASATSDDNGHGSHVAGIIGALSNGTGVIGVAPGATIVPLKVLDAGGSGSYSSIISAINYCTGLILDNQLDPAKCVVNLSLGGPGNQALDDAMVAAANLGVRFAVAAGNSAADVDGYSPARSGWHPNIYTVAATDSLYNLAAFSNYDNVAAGAQDKVDFAEPGVSVISWYRNGDGSFSLYYLSGTSMAAPMAAGALLMGGIAGNDPVTTPSAIQSDPFGLVNRQSSPPPRVVSLPQISIQATSASGSEGNSGTTPFTFTVSRGGADLSGTSTVEWSLRSGSTDAADFSGALSGSLSFAANETSRTLTIDVKGDTSYETDETFSVVLANPTGATLGTTTAQGTIRNDDPVQRWGTTGNDTLVGTAFADRLAGVPATGTSSSALGRGQVDTLTGLAGADTFLLGDARGVFYNDGSSRSAGSADYALITDFHSSEGDLLQLRRGTYFTAVVSGSLNLSWDSNANGVFDSRDELIARLSGVSALGTNDIVWV